MEIGRFAFLRLPLGDLGATYDDHLRLIGKRVMDFLLALIELFFARCYAEELYKRLLVENRRFRSVDPKFHLEGVAPTNHSSSQKTRLNVWYNNLDRSFFRFVTIHACDGQTDGQTEFSSQYRVCITCSAVKTIANIFKFTTV